MRKLVGSSCIAASLALFLAPALAQDLPKVSIGMSGWTGFAPLSLADKAAGC